MSYDLSNDDDVFNEFLKNQEEAEKKAKNRAKYQGTSFDEIKYVGLSKEEPTIVRFVGNFQAPGGKRKDPSDMKEIFISKIKGDDGKIMFLYLPLRDDDPERDHLMWKIIDAVTKKEWIKDPVSGKNKPVEVVKIENPEIYELVTKGGFTEEDGKWPYLYAKGWKGTQMLLINCIDRKDNWCEENKHTKLLSKKVDIDTDGREWAEMGVPSYGFLSTLIGLRQNYGSWENYDCVITKTGEKLETTTNIFNGTVSTSKAAIDAKVDKQMGISSDYYKFISSENTLTIDELNYERYDLDKNFRVTSYHQIEKRLSKSIKKIDGVLNTHFYDKLKELVEEESQKWEEEKKEKEALKQEVKESDVSEKQPEIIKRVVETSVKQELSPDKISFLKGWDSLTNEEKSFIKDVIIENGSLVKVEYDESAGALLACSTDDGKGCGFESPARFSVCPICAAKYA